MLAFRPVRVCVCVYVCMLVGESERLRQSQHFTIPYRKVYDFFFVVI